VAVAGIAVDGDGVGGLVVFIVIAQFIELILQQRIGPQQLPAGGVVGLQLLEAVGVQPLLADLGDQMRHPALLPQQVAALIVDQRQAGALPVEIFRHFDADFAVFPLRQGVEQIALAAQ
jgi:hypothetical protein